MKKFLLFLLISNWITAQWSISNAQRDALIGIYNTTNGTLWSQTWDLEKDPRSWYGIIVKNGNVEEINLKGNALKGNFPSTLSVFKNLKKLDLSNNQLTGDVSSGISSLTSLTRLDISNNYLTGDPTSSLSIFPQLQEVSIGNNKFQINNINGLLQANTNLLILNLSNLGLTTVPEKISSYTKLMQLDLSNNNISTGFGQLKNLTTLRELSLSGNRLSQIPTDLLSLGKLLSLDLSNNLFTTNLTGLNSFTYLEWLSLENNQLVQVPAELKQLQNIIHLNLGKNNINTGYSNLVHFKNLQQLYLNDNNISGAIPSELLNLPGLMMLSLSNNDLGGNLSDNLPSICDVSNNRFAQETITDYISVHTTSADRFFYSPQRYGNKYDEVQGIIGQSANLWQSLSGSGYYFTWFKNLDQNTDTHTEQFSINSVQESDYGAYTAEAFYVKKLPGYIMQLSLFREPIYLVKQLDTEDNTLKDIKIFPNPTAQYLNIFAKKYAIEQSTIYDLSGKQVLTSKSLQINVANLPSGAYVINIKTDQGYKTFKFIKH